MIAILRPLVFIACTSPALASAQVSYPSGRSVVADGEVYNHSAFGAWRVECFREELGDDTCFVSQTIVRPDAGVQVVLSVHPIVDWTAPVNADVDVWPRAIISVSSWSEASQYDGLMAEIALVDGQTFDDYRCLTRTPDRCERGPEVTESGIRALQGAETITISFDYGDWVDPLFEETVEMGRFSEAYEVARLFNAETAGIDLESPGNTWEVCSFIEDGELQRITYLLDPEAPYSAPSMRETLSGARGSTDCPSYAILSYFTRGMTPAQRSLFCLVHDEADDLGYLGVDEGASNALRVCESPPRTVCDRVNAGREVVAGVAAGATAFLAASGGGTVATSTAGVTVVAHSSQAWILTGGTGYIAGTLGTAGTTALGVVTSPLWISGAAVTLVAAGGTLFVCSGE